MEARGLKVNVKVMGSMEEIVKEKGTRREGRPIPSIACKIDEFLVSFRVFALAVHPSGHLPPAFTAARPRSIRTPASNSTAPPPAAATINRAAPLTLIRSSTASQIARAHHRPGCCPHAIPLAQPPHHPRVGRCQPSPPRPHCRDHQPPAAALPTNSRALTARLTPPREQCPTSRRQPQSLPRAQPPRPAGLPRPASAPGRATLAQVACLACPLRKQQLLPIASSLPRPPGQQA
nr:uncharacterized protein LOC127323558 [Lolium perenne]